VRGVDEPLCFSTRARPWQTLPWPLTSDSFSSSFDSTRNTSKTFPSTCSNHSVRCRSCRPASTSSPSGQRTAAGKRGSAATDRSARASTRCGSCAPGARGRSPVRQPQQQWRPSCSASRAAWCTSSDSATMHWASGGTSCSSRQQQQRQRRTAASRAAAAQQQQPWTSSAHACRTRWWTWPSRCSG